MASFKRALLASQTVVMMIGERCWSGFENRMLGRKQWHTTYVCPTGVRLILDERAGPEGADLVLQQADFPFDAGFWRLLCQRLECGEPGLCDVDLGLLAAECVVGNRAGLKLVRFERFVVIGFEGADECLRAAVFAVRTGSWSYRPRGFAADRR